MARVQFVSLHGQDEVDVLDFGLKFKHGEHKDVPDHVAAALLRNPNFVDPDAAERVPDAPASSVEQNAPASEPALLAASETSQVDASTAVAQESEAD